MSENKYKGYGAILGDIVGTPYEMSPIYTKEFDFFNSKNHWSDDTILTIATMDAILNDIDYTLAYKYWGSKYYGDYYGKNFKEWIKRKDFTSNDSFGNGAVMRISPIGYAYNWPWCATQAYDSVRSSHDNDEAKPYGVEFASLIRKLDRGDVNKLTIHNDMLMNSNHYFFCPELKKFEKFKVSCKYTVPVAVRCFYETHTVEDTIRLAVSLGGDCDTIASMGAELQVAYKGKLEKHLADYVESMIEPDMLYILKAFNERF